jgi:transposase
MANEFWLSDTQWARLAPLLPNKPRGIATAPRSTSGGRRVDDRRVISGIIHGLKSGGRWVDAPPCYAPA